MHRVVGVGAVDIDRHRRCLVVMVDESVRHVLGLHREHVPFIHENELLQVALLNGMADTGQALG